MQKKQFFIEHRKQLEKLKEKVAILKNDVDDMITNPENYTKNDLKEVEKRVKQLFALCDKLKIKGVKE